MISIIDWIKVDTMKHKQTYLHHNKKDGLKSLCLVIVNKIWWENHQIMRENEIDLINWNHQIMISKDDEMNELMSWKWK